MSAAQPLGQPGKPCPGPAPIDRWELLSLVTALRKPLGLADRDVMVLRAHLSVLPHGPLVPGALNMSFMQLSEIQDRACGMDERRFRRGEVQLEARGLITRRLSANGRRFPERGADGRIIAAYGIDLSPVIARHPELCALKATLEDEARALKQRHNSLSARLSSLLRCLTPSDRLLALKDALRNALRRSTVTEEELDAFETEIASMERSDPAPEHTTEVDPTPRKLRPQPDTYTDDAGQSVRHIESEHKDINKHPAPAYSGHFRNAWCQTTSLSEFYPSPPSSEHEAKRSIIEFSSFIGLGRNSVEAALSIAGLENTIRLVDYLARKVDQISKPQGYLKSMLARLLRGDSVAGGSVHLSRPAHVQALS
ncbi:replication initiation protein [Salipiger pallidus]|uniref:Replication initiation protein n=2 Tax=Salipiger pallidus TaxID=1775170 RepID=A0A8J3EIH5_9RHOB|nr:replication initiation protein [Salipiger pallidus]